MGYNNYCKSIDFFKNAIQNWDFIKIIVFDAPQLLDMPYIERLFKLQQVIPTNHPNLSVITPYLCTNKFQIDFFYTQIQFQFGEGIVLRSPKAWYFSPNSLYFKKVLFNYKFIN
jgi:ATP-dependent DNA ligase